MHHGHGFTLGIHLVTATGTFTSNWFNYPFSLTGAFLDATDQFIFFSVDELQIVINQLCQSLFHFAFGNVPVSFGYKFAHIISFFRHAVQHGAEILLQVACRPFKGLILQQRPHF